MNYSNFFLAIAIALSPLQDTALAGTPLGFLGRAIAFAPLLFLLPSAAMVCWKDGVKFPQLVAAIALFLNTIFIIIKFDGVYLGESLVYKSFSYILLLTITVLPMHLNIRSVDEIKIPVFVGILVVYIGFVGGDIAKINFISNNSFLHYNSNIQQRARGFTLEASLLGSQLIVFGAIAAKLVKNRLLSASIFAVSVFIACFEIGSKGAIPAVAVALVLALRFKPRTLLAVSILCIPAFYVAQFAIVPYLNTQFAGDFREGTSSATRLSTFVAVGLTLKENPLGYGFGGLAVSLHQQIPLAMQLLRSSVSGAWNFTEVYNMFIHAKDSFYLTGKSGLLDCLLTMGIIGGWFFYVNFVKLALNPTLRNSYYISFAIIYSAVALATYIPLLGSYHFIPLYILARHLIRIGSLEPPLAISGLSSTNPRTRGWGLVNTRR